MFPIREPINHEFITTINIRRMVIGAANGKLMRLKFLAKIDSIIYNGNIHISGAKCIRISCPYNRSGTGNPFSCNIIDEKLFID